MKENCEVSKMVLRCLEAFQTGYDSNSKLVEINWQSWYPECTSEIRCVFSVGEFSGVRCSVYPTISRTHGANLDTGRTWSLSN